MAMTEEEIQPIIIKRVVNAHGHHGGSWKVAFADFATAMMAFFLLMWLMGGTTAEQKGAISEYFKNPSAVQGASPMPSPSAIQGPGGPSSSMIKLGGSTELYKNPAPADAKETDDPTVKAALVKSAEEAEKQTLEGLMNQLKNAIDEQDALKPFKDQILLDLTADGLRIQIIDKENRSMFDSGSADLKDYSSEVLKELAMVIGGVQNRISISGHTDATPYVRRQYSNWELSADRANAARRALLSGGLPEEKIGRVVGLASSALLDPAHPQNPINRRISIIVMNARTEAAIQQESGSLLAVQTDKQSQEVSTANPAPASQ
jgi:chemotaxis protein MotB